VITVAFQNVFCLEIYQNNMYFIFLKLIFNITHQNNLKLYKKLIFNKTNSHFYQMHGQHVAKRAKCMHVSPR
jgi:hypothetical protein